MKEGQRESETVLGELAQLACRLGASAASPVATTEVSVEDGLADLCREPPCENYGLSAHCPPHVEGPSGFRELLRDFRQAVVFKIDVPTEVLLSDKRRDFFRLLQEIAARVEQAAVDLGYRKSRAYAGGCCKPLFCEDRADCRVLAAGGECRHPDLARPSMSGFGINVFKLMEAVGWRANRITRETDAETVPMGTLCGLVLIG